MKVANSLIESWIKDIFQKKKHALYSSKSCLYINIIKAINYCHKIGIAHRDLKPENFIYLTKAEDSPIKVIDFGLGTLFEDK